MLTDGDSHVYMIPFPGYIKAAVRIDAEGYASIYINWRKMSDNGKTANNEYAVRDKSGSVTFEWDDTDDFFGFQTGIYVTPKANGKTFNDYRRLCIYQCHGR